MTKTPATRQPADAPLVVAHQIRKSFGDNEVLRGVDLTVDTGTVTVIIGPSGSGKTTLLRSLNALEIPDSGTVRIGDVEVDFGSVGHGRRLGRADRRTLAELRAQSGMVFQEHNLFPHKTALENVTEGPRITQHRPEQEVRAEATQLLADVGLADQADKYPHQLSGGQKQRVGIARALAMRPAVVLFDEPTSALDPELVGDVLAVIKDLAAGGRTMVIVTHEIEFARQVGDQVVFVDGGVIVERGTPAEVIGKPQQDRTRGFLRRILSR
ncbi:amino acid ABC transporter ATP-binding protein [Williamsia sterculiae]|uniref:Amino acid ABC transporter ATP-binding protein, PAAT family n=1 Tax=Williamsia sterculiae TaxID=1344003 RepID=A0A1N7GWR3_9NOCA|nr:amino acid ABC transporter ATP-binding protein [Williamsia sterculiae]SIS17035.1 amino acid ABC transporter ATP-binding protein, PAAT family [Williamsia sterculiae]